MEHNRVIYERPYDAEVEYLESGNTQFIDTGIIATNNTNFKMKVYTDSIQRQIFGQYELIQSQHLSFGTYFFNNTNKLVLYGVNNTYLPTRGSITDKLVEIELRDNKFILDSSVFNVTRNNVIGNKTLYLFKLNGLEITPDSHLKVYYCKIWNEDTLVRDFIPVRKGSTGFMYDKVSKKLFGNQGRGSFILGPDVSNPVPNIRRVFRFGNKRFVMPIRVVKEVHVTFGQFPFISNVDEVVYTQDINRRSKSTQTPKNITYTGQSFQVWAWTENNAREKLTCFIGCEYFYPQYGSKLFVHSNLTTGTNGILRNLKATSFEFCKCWDATYITSLQYAFKQTVVTDFSFLQDWKLINLNSFQEAFSQLSNINVEPFMRCQLGSSSHRLNFGGNAFYGNHYIITTWDGMCRNWYLKLTAWGDNNSTFIPNCYHLDMTNWDLTEWNSYKHIFFTNDYFGLRVRKITTPILPLQTLPMKLPYTMYDMETEQAYTEIPLNLDRQLTLYKNKSDFGK